MLKEVGVNNSCKLLVCKSCQLPMRFLSREVAKSEHGEKVMNVFQCTQCGRLKTE